MRMGSALGASGAGGAVCVRPSHLRGVWHGVHLSFLVDTIVGAASAILKMGWPDAYKVAPKSVVVRSGSPESAKRVLADLVMAWARESVSGQPRYIGEIDAVVCR